MNAETTVPESILKMQFRTDAGLGSSANIGMIVLSSDQTLELEFRTLMDFEGVALYHARIPNEMDITEETLAKMEAELPITASLLPGSLILMLLVTAVHQALLLLVKIRLKRQSELHIPVFLLQIH